MCVSTTSCGFSDCACSMHEWLLNGSCLLVVVVALLGVTSTDDMVVRHLGDCPWQIPYSLASVDGNGEG
jgi:hypothetical protein